VNLSIQEYERRVAANAEAQRIFSEKLGWIMSQHQAEIRAAVESADGRWVDGAPAAIRMFEVKTTKED
jgi:hypothetical protein